jgi:hypothetical protein
VGERHRIVLIDGVFPGSDIPASDDDERLAFDAESYVENYLGGWYARDAKPYPQRVSPRDFAKSPRDFAKDPIDLLDKDADYSIRKFMLHASDDDLMQLKAKWMSKAKAAVES